MGSVGNLYPESQFLLFESILKSQGHIEQQ